MIGESSNWMRCKPKENKIYVLNNEWNERGHRNRRGNDIIKSENIQKHNIPEHCIRKLSTDTVQKDRKSTGSIEKENFVKNLLSKEYRWKMGKGKLKDNRLISRADYSWSNKSTKNAMIRPLTREPPNL